MDKLTFTFTAISTSIKDGQVKFTLPDGWTPAVAPDRTAAGQVLDNPGELTINDGDGGFNRDRRPPLVSQRLLFLAGQTVTVAVPRIGDKDGKIDNYCLISPNMRRPKLSALSWCNLTQPKPISLRRLLATSGHREPAEEGTVQGRWK